MCFSLVHNCYLLCRETIPTTAELQNLLGKVKVELAFIEGQISFYSRQSSVFNVYGTKLKERQNNSSAALRGVVSRFVQSELECSVQNMGIDTGPTDSCKIMSTQSYSLQSALNKQAEATANVGNYNWADKQRYVGMLKERKNELERQKNYILSKLGIVDPLVGSFANSDPSVIKTVIDSEREDKWLQFEFDSEEKESSSTSTSFTSRSRIEGKVNLGIVKGSYKRVSTYTSRQFESEMSQANLKAKGKLLRVHIKRPWFKPEVFDDRKLNFVRLHSYKNYLTYTVKN